MRRRGDVFGDWADPTLHHRDHNETLDDGTSIDVQVRLSRTGSTQMFVGVSAPSGIALQEETFDRAQSPVLRSAMGIAYTVARRSL
jgi:hypothetical protein